MQGGDDDDSSWMHDEEMWEEDRGDSEKPPREVQCRRCLHWVSPGMIVCPWCGRPLEAAR